MADQQTTQSGLDAQTTGHEWDGIRELDTPLPNWWRWVFYTCIVWSIGYWIAMPAWPTFSGYTKGLLGYSSRGAVADDVAAAQKAQAGLNQKIAAATAAQISQDPDLLEFAMAGGRSAFLVHCSQCHGSGAQGAKGYPNLNDDEWLWGGTLAAITTTITNGARNETENARVSQMPAFLKDEILKPEQVEQVADYVMLISGQGKNTASAQAGKAIFAEQCAACHKPDGSGNPEFGAPPLNNDIWLYGGDRDTIRQTIAFSRGGVMPAWGQILDPVTIKKLALYVHALGGGK